MSENEQQFEGRLRAEIERTAAFRSELRRFLARTGVVTATARLTAERYDLLLMIKAAEAGDPSESTMTALAKQLRLRQQAVSQLVRRTEEAGLVERARSETDGRVSYLRLTDEGNRRLMQAFRALHADRALLAEELTRLQAQFHSSD